MNDDAMSMAMFWTGLLMVLAPVVSASVVIGVWWYTKRKRRPDSPPAPLTADPESQR